MSLTEWIHGSCQLLSGSGLSLGKSSLLLSKELSLLSLDGSARYGVACQWCYHSVGDKLYSLCNAGSSCDEVSESLRAILDRGRGDLGEFESTRFLVIPALGSSGSLGLSMSEGSLLLGQQLSLLSLDDGAISEYQL